MATLKILEDEALIATELERVNEIIKFIESNNMILSEDSLIDYIISYFNQNSTKVLVSNATPMNILLKAIARMGQINSGLINKSVSRMLYTQTSGDDLSLCAANYGYSRIEAKPSTMVIILTASKKITINQGTSFTDGRGNVWLTNMATTLEENIPTRISATCNVSGPTAFISPLSATNTISGVTNIEVDTTSIVVGRDQESDTELKASIAQGIMVFGTDIALMRDLVSLRMVNSAYSKTNPFLESMVENGITIDSRMRFVSLRLTSVNISTEEADMIAKTIKDGTIYGSNFQPPKDKKVKVFFGITEDKLTAPKEEGGAGLEGVDNTSNCVLVRMLSEYRNYVDVYFYLAQPTYIDVLLGIRYKSAYENTEKENMKGNLKILVSQVVAETSQVGTSLLASEINNKLFTNSSINDMIEIRSVQLKKHDSSILSQALDADAYEYFEVYTEPAIPYAGVVISEE